MFRHKKQIKQLNGTIDYQFFCDIHLGSTRFTNFKIVSQIRCELAANLGINTLKKDLFAHRKPYMDSKNQITEDASCYESELRYPTPQKLLWEAIYWLYRQLKKTRKIVGAKMPCSNFETGVSPKNYKEEKKLKVIISKEIATRLEGIFGKEKEYYYLKKIKSKTKDIEIL